MQRLQNLQAYKYNEAVHPLLMEGSSVLKHLNITSFRYFRVFETGQYLNLSTNKQWLLERLQIPDNGESMAGAMRHASPDKPYHFLWPTDTDDVILSHMKAHGICNGFTLYKRLPDHSVEAWSFAAPPNDLEMQNFYINNLNVLFDFTTFFNSKFHTLVEPSKDNLACFENTVDISLLEEEGCTTPHFTDERGQYLARHRGRAQFLTRREYECLTQLAKGKTCKEIARVLGISNRTVECYVAKVKQKFGFSHKSELIDLFRNNFLYN